MYVITNHSHAANLFWSLAVFVCLGCANCAGDFYAQSVQELMCRVCRSSCKQMTFNHFLQL